jgi:hypothetical protein
MRSSTVRFWVPILAGCISAASARAQDLHVTVDGTNLAPESHATVRIRLLTNQVLPPKGYKAARTRYVACIAGPAFEVPGQPQTFPELGPSMPLPDTYCKQKTQIHVFLSQPEDGNDIASGAATEHVFADKLPLPKDPRGTMQHPGGTDVWIIARFSYRLPASDFSKVLFGWNRVVYECKPAANGATAETCSYRTEP